MGIGMDPSQPRPVRQGRFPWRIVPVTLLYLYGGLALLDGVLGIGTIARGGSVLVNHRPASDLQVWGAALSFVGLGAHGACVIAAGRYLWQWRWRRCFVAIATALGLLLIVVATVFLTR